MGDLLSRILLAKLLAKSISTYTKATTASKLTISQSDYDLRRILNFNLSIVTVLKLELNFFCLELFMPIILLSQRVNQAVNQLDIAVCQPGYVHHLGFLHPQQILGGHMEGGRQLHQDLR